MDEIDNKALEAVAWDCTQWPKWLRDVVDQTNETADRLDMSSEQAHAFAALLTRASKLAALEDESKTLREAVELFQSYGCPVCGGDCGSANPPVLGCPMQTAQSALSKPAALPAEGKALADWSNLPRDIYVISAIAKDSVVTDVHCCSVPMVTAPEVRYVRADLATPPAPQPVGEVHPKDICWTHMPSYGEVKFQQLVEAVAQAIYADRHFAWPPRDIDQTRFIGHQIVPTINFNSLNRIVSAFVRATLSASPSPAAQEDGE